MGNISQDITCATTHPSTYGGGRHFKVNACASHVVYVPRLEASLFLCRRFLCNQPSFIGGGEKQVV